MSKKENLTTEKLILKFQKIHGEFTQQPRLHLRGSNGCKTCNKFRKKRK